VHVRGLIPADEIARLGLAVDNAVTSRKALDTRPLVDKSPYEQSFIQCQYIWEDFPEIRPLTFHPELGRMLGALLGASRVRLWHDQALYKEAGGRPTEAHQDHAYWPISEDDTITAWIPLHAVDHETGCMGYVPGSHNDELEFIDIFRTPGAGAALQARQTRPTTYVPCEPGDVIFHHGRTVHMAKPNASGATRRAYTAIYFKDGCTRGGDRPHPSVDRDGIAQGAPIDGLATPIVWPLPGGGYPEPGPWPETGDPRVADRRRLGVIPDRKS
jgi:ectoine hydroxylase-related dioxygenase (phytanoyl-CoA dioxygenase family)